MSQLVITAKVEFRKQSRSKPEPSTGTADPATAPPRLPRVTKLMALAIRLDRLVAERAVESYADAARLGNVSRSRITQIISLLQLAPDIQEELLFLPRVTSGKDPIGERNLRPIAATTDWTTQRAMWRRIINRVRE